MFSLSESKMDLGGGEVGRPRRAVVASCEFGGGGRGEMEMEMEMEILERGLRTNNSKQKTYLLRRRLRLHRRIRRVTTRFKWLTFFGRRAWKVGVVCHGHCRHCCCC